jgi:hypothetical protein
MWGWESSSRGLISGLLLSEGRTIGAMTGRPPSVSTAVIRAVKAARDAGRIRPEHEPYVALARMVAGELATMHRKGISTTDLNRLSTRLEVLLSRLPLGEEAKPDDRAPVTAGGAGQNGAHTTGLAVVVGSGAQVGDTALP